MTLFGAYALLDGIIAVGIALQERCFVGHWWVLLLEGLTGIFLGVLTFIWPAITTFTLLYLIAAWAIITGLFEVITAFSNQDSLAREWTLALAGILSILLGVLLASQPAMGLHAIVWFAGIYAFIFGVLLIARSFHHRSIAS